MNKGTVRIEFHTDNAYFDDYRLDGIASILSGIAYEIETHYTTEGVIRDGNGNAIGTWTTEGTNE